MLTARQMKELGLLLKSLDSEVQIAAFEGVVGTFGLAAKRRMGRQILEHKRKIKDKERLDSNHDAVYAAAGVYIP